MSPDNQRTKCFRCRVFLKCKWADYNDADTAILILGAMGVGKSQLINDICGRDTAAVFDLLTPGTTEVTIHPFEDTNGRHWLFLDTPGLDAGIDDQIVKSVSKHLSHLYDHGIRRLTVVYLTSILSHRQGHSDSENMKILKRIVGQEGLPEVIFGTTHWPNNPEQASGFQKRDEELKRIIAKSISPQTHESSLNFVRLDSSEAAQGILSLARSQQQGPLRVQKHKIDTGSRWKKMDMGQYLQLSSSLKERIRHWFM